MAWWVAVAVVRVIIALAPLALGRLWWGLPKMAGEPPSLSNP